MLLSCRLPAFSQKETNIWYFGFNAGIDFNSGAPVGLSNGAISTSEGSASISDSAGNLLFYTDGIVVKNKNHITMANGTGLKGGLSSTQSALIVPRPLSDSLYYIFTLSEQLAPGGLNYSVVDMSLQGGLGEVILKNEQMDKKSCEKITAVCHSNQKDIWVIAHDWNNNEFQAYLLTEAGVDTPGIISSVGSVMNGGSGNTIGYLKGSPSGSRLALAVWTANFFEVYDFDKTTGIVSNALTLPSYTGASSGAYGVEFSPNGQFLYGSVITPGYVYQWNLDAGSDSLILASKTLVGTSAVNFNGALQLASDGKIYMAKYGSNWLATINEPDSLGMACDFVDNGFNFGYGSNGLGLPNIYPCFFETPEIPQAAFSSSDTLICQKFCIDYFDSSQNDPFAWEWIFEGGSPATSNLQNPSQICYNTPGVYDVTLISTSASGTDTLFLDDFITVYATPPFPAITQNGNTLTASAAVTYQWQLNGNDIPGATDSSYEATESGVYSVLITDENGCVNSASIKLSITGIVSEVSAGSLVVFPNPSNGRFSVQIPGSGAREIHGYIFNALGKIMYEQTLLPGSDRNLEIQLPETLPGCYLLHLVSNEFVWQQPLIIHSK